MRIMDGTSKKMDFKKRNEGKSKGFLSENATEDQLSKNRLKNIKT
jgi:Rad3-related DNA helicase